MTKNEELDQADRDVARGQELARNCLECMLHILKDLHDDAGKCLRNGTVGEPVEFNPPFFRKYTDAHKLFPLTDDQVRALGDKLVVEALNGGLIICDTYDLAHGMFHAQVENQGINELKH